MASLSSKTIHLILLIITIICYTNANHVLAKPKPTHLKFYLHETFLGPDATIAQVVAPPNPPNSSVGFGMLGVVDDVLRTGVEPNSELIGRLQGIYSQASLEKIAYATLVDLVFTAGEYNGSTIAVVGSIGPGVVTERPVIGGSGVFRWARGYTVNTPISSDNVSFVEQFDVYLKYD